MAADVRTPPEQGVFARPLACCPACGSTHLDPVVETLVREVHHLCDECGRCWDVAFGAVRRVVPATCSGCRGRGRCVTVFAADADRAGAAG